MSMLWDFFTGIGEIVQKEAEKGLRFMAGMTPWTALIGAFESYEHLTEGEIPSFAQPPSFIQPHEQEKESGKKNSYASSSTTTTTQATTDYPSFNPLATLFPPLALWETYNTAQQPEFQQYVTKPLAEGLSGIWDTILGAIEWIKPYLPIIFIIILILFILWVIK